MLGIDNDKPSEKCTCETESHCTFDKTKCSCTAYCTLHAGSMAKYLKPKYFTISPDMRQYNTIKECVTEWHDCFYKMRKNIRDGVFVMEMAGGIRPHFHCIVDVTNLVGYTKTLFAWQKYHNVKNHNKYTNGYHYLFKEIDETKELTDIDPIYTYDDILKQETDRILKRSLQRLERKQHLLDDNIKEVPAWMRGDNKND